MYEQSLRSVTSQGHPQMMDRLGCPIEMEPKTLTEGELSNAREAAVEIIQTKVPKEASTIFIQGKKAVKTAEQTRTEIKTRDRLEKLVGEGEGSGVRCGSSDLPFADDEISDGITSREPFSSPF
ncbi:hypothetical protein OPV22_023370 [Ensete ventricosum]|uniref:SMP domain-containing protein n=1 Tax=Ensete ventricosum TaxID=4639 RepID=A0AAV8QQG9_ENSVE|nr:hypothetical protein OPV22_023370 [Ensete ventricosum]